MRLDSRVPDDDHQPLNRMSPPLNPPVQRAFRRMPAVVRHGVLLAGLTLGTGCSFHAYTPSALDATLVPTTVASGRLDDPAGAELLKSLDAVVTWPPAQWSPVQLGLFALARSPALRASDAALVAATNAREVAVQRQNPRVSFGLEHHSLVDDNQSGEWSIGPSIEYTLSPVSRRALLAARATLAVRDAVLDRLDVAWTVRSRAVDAALALTAQQEQQPLLAAETAARGRAIEAARAEVAAGVADPFEWQTLQLDANAARLARLGSVTARATAEAALASALDLPVSALAELALAAPPVVAPPAPGALQQQMLQQHPGVLRALTAYERAEHDLALAVAEQYPSITLNPGYFFDQGDHVWSLVGGVVVPVLARHETKIRSAEAARTAAREHFHAVQAAQIAALQEAHAQWRAARLALREARRIAADVRAAQRALEARAAEGLGNLLGVARAAQQSAEVAVQVALCRAEVRRTLQALEHVARVPWGDPAFARFLNNLEAAPAVQPVTAAGGP